MNFDFLTYIFVLASCSISFSFHYQLKSNSYHSSAKTASALNPTLIIRRSRPHSPTCPNRIPSYLFCDNYNEVNSKSVKKLEDMTTEEIMEYARNEITPVGKVIKSTSKSAAPRGETLAKIKENKEYEKYWDNQELATQKILSKDRTIMKEYYLSNIAFNNQSVRSNSLRKIKNFEDMDQEIMASTSAKASVSGFQIVSAALLLGIALSVIGFQGVKNFAASLTADY